MNKHRYDAANAENAENAVYDSDDSSKMIARNIVVLLETSAQLKDYAKQNESMYDVSTVVAAAALLEQYVANNAIRALREIAK